ncbi:hypothetical protein [Lysinibacillus sp. G4S2]|uniref:hypothetical protein n=1 Tax=Lysinibacillus sp. G4S2 TaxID=3055859 RepID=UPI00259FE150|nr:hypothetical protein [Lysinibacillus sp. G4S2]MDM5248316.1 hypothetical protein [Lysinibacillus sp. G4S2]
MIVLSVASIALSFTLTLLSVTSVPIRHFGSSFRRFDCFIRRSALFSVASVPIRRFDYFIRHSGSSFSRFDCFIRRSGSSFRRSECSIRRILKYFHKKQKTLRNNVRRVLINSGIKNLIINLLGFLEVLLQF